MPLDTGNLVPASGSLTLYWSKSLEAFQNIQCLEFQPTYANSVVVWDGSPATSVNTNFDNGNIDPFGYESISVTVSPWAHAMAGPQVAGFSPANLSGLSALMVGGVLQGNLSIYYSDGTNKPLVFEGTWNVVMVA